VVLYIDPNLDADAVTLNIDYDDSDPLGVTRDGAA
jgi:hypothetical protein